MLYHRWRALLLPLGFLILGLFFYYLFFPAAEKDAQKNLDSMNEQQGTEWNGFSVTIDNARAVTDNPWGINAGIVDTETDGTCIFLTPGTAAYLYLNQTICPTFEMKIHPWVASSSDGVEVLIELLNTDDEVLFSESVFVDHESCVFYHPDSSFLSGCSKIVFQCKNGLNNNSDADWLIIKEKIYATSGFAADGYVKSVTYFGDAWPINFWNSELSHLKEDFQQIKNDGFNSIIIVIPWKEFQTSTDPIQYSDYAFERLDTVLAAAKGEGLDVYARIGYIWDFYNDTGEWIHYRFFNLLIEETVREAWMDYAQKLYNHLRASSSFKGAFITWEDFWGILSVCDIESDDTRIQYAQSMGYQNWLEEHYKLKEFNDAYLTQYSEFESIPIPHRDEPAMKSMYEFYDDFLNRFLQQAQTVFPNLSMEVRLDADLVRQKDGTYRYYTHESTYSCANSDFTSTMYSIPMGFENIGEKVSALEALRHTSYILNNLNSQNMGKPVYVEQFLFADNTPQFSYNAQIVEDEVDDYLRMVGEILLQYTSGYGIWTYRDYANNMFYNSGFSLSERGWESIGDVEFVQMDGSMVSHIKAPASLQQAIPDIRNHFDQEYFTVSFDAVEVIEPGEAIVHMGNDSQSVIISQKGTYSITFPKNSSFDFVLELTSGDVMVDSLCMYSFVQQGFLYDIENQEYPLIQDIRILNNILTTMN